MKVQNEEQLLDEDFRKVIIDEIEGPENCARKLQMKRRYDVFKDNTKEYVLAMMSEESEDKKVVQEIIHRLANISFCRKIIDKKAMVYKDGVKRIVSPFTDAAQTQIDDLYDFVNMNSTMKKTNKYTELFKNAAGAVLPYKDPATDKFYYKPSVLMPFLYDVVEDENNSEMARCYIFSYNTNNSTAAYQPKGMSGSRGAGTGKVIPFRAGDGIDQTIADSPNDMGNEKKEYIWWTTNYHFTTDEKGATIANKSPEGEINPIGEIPLFNFSQDQDGAYWAVGGEDIIDGSILLNVLLTDLFYISKYQGMGIGYMFGKGVPKNMRVGASSFITMEVEEGDPTPQIGFATSSPPIAAHLQMIETYVALLLSTNNLESGSVSVKLSAPTAASGIHEMVKRAENMDDIQDQREIYRDGEPKLFNIMKKWHNLYFDRGQLSEDLAEIGKLKDDMSIKLKFPDPQPFVTEKEKLEIIKLRLELGIDSMVDAIIKDNGDLTEEEAEQKLLKILEEKLLESNRKLKLFANEQEEKMAKGMLKGEEDEKVDDEEDEKVDEKVDDEKELSKKVEDKDGK